MKKILLSLMTIMASVAMFADEVTFDFSSATAFGYADPEPEKFTQLENGNQVKQGNIIITANFTEGNGMRFFKNKNGVVNLRAYKPSKVVISTVDGSAITGIQIDGANLTSTYVTCDGYDNGTWSGNAASVTLEVIKSTVQFNKMTVTYGTATPVNVEAPTISFDAATKTVTITPADPSYSTFYTLDGSVPSDASTIYEGPFTIEKTTTVKAISTNDDDEASSVTSKLCEVAADAITTCKELTDKCTSKDGEIVTFTFTDLMVTGANGSYVFVKDATGSFLLYKSGTGLKRGDKISGTVTGNLVLYSGVKELSNLTTWNVTVVSSGNEVTPVTVAAADVTADIQNQYIRLEGLTYLPNEQDKDYYYFQDETGKVTVFDKFKLMSKVNLSDAFTYNINVIATVYNSNPQVYVCSESDVEIVSDKLNPQTRFVTDAFMGIPGFEFAIEADDYETLSDGAVTFTSSNPEVATVENGVVICKSVGVADITLKTAETETYQESTATAVVCVVSGEHEGLTMNDAWEAEDVAPIYEFSDHVASDTLWVHGYIVGFANGTMNKCVFDLAEAADTIASNLLIASAPDVTDPAKCVPVQLVSGTSIRKALNLLDNPDNLGKEVWLRGTIEAYFSIAGIKNLCDYSFDAPSAVIPGDANGDGVVNVTDISSIASYILGDTPDSFDEEAADVDGDGEINVADISATASIILNGDEE